jgi:hypothetical protein
VRAIDGMQRNPAGVIVVEQIVAEDAVVDAVTIDSRSTLKRAKGPRIMRFVWCRSQ